MGRLDKLLSTSQTIILGFALLILSGSLLLMLDISTVGEGGACFQDALFTATSAVCVTGLVLHDTVTYWSTFGQTVILILIQIGGMGVVTVAIALTRLSGKEISLKQRSTMQEAISANKLGGIVKMTRFIIKMTILFELIGAIIMAPTFIKDFGVLKGIWYSIFHSVSAFCNAGFDLMGVRGQFSSLTTYRGSAAINIAIMSLIVIGGIGFITWDDIKTKKFNVRRLSMQSKVILMTTILLIFFPALFFFFNEFQDLPLKERILASLFQSVTPRTAGFNTADLTLYGEVGLAITIILMLVGGSPGSTAGGMKTTTFAVMLSSAISAFRRREHTHFFGRRVEEDTVRDAGTILIMYIVFFLTGGFIISQIDHIPLMTALFETASAVGTVGLTLGITPSLGRVSQAILIALMFIGRTGGLTLMYSALSRDQSNTARLPKERLNVG